MSRLFHSAKQLNVRHCSNGVVNPNGMAHIQLSISSKHWNDSVKFYKKWLNEFFGMTIVFDNKDTLYHVGGRTAVALSRCDTKYEDQCFDQRRIGLHHSCFRLRSNEDVEKTYNFLIDFNKDENNKKKIKIMRGPEKGVWAPGYYSILFEDFDGIRWECNYVPKSGWLDPKLANKLPVKAGYSML
eukprot:6155_1